MVEKYQQKRIMPVGTQNPSWLRFVRLETRSFFFGDPLPLLVDAISAVFECDRVSENVQSFGTGCQQIIQSQNEKLSAYCIELKLRKGSPFEKHGRRYALRLVRRSVNHNLSGVDLIERYINVQKSKTIEVYETSIWRKLFKSGSVSFLKVQEYTSERRNLFDDSFQDTFNTIIKALKQWTKRLGELFLKTAPERSNESFFYLYGLGEVRNAFLSSFISAYHGFFRESFKTYRDVLEMLALSSFLDILNLRDSRGQNPYINAMVDGWWHKALVGLKNKKIIDYAEVERDLVHLQDAFQKLNASLFLTLTGRVLCTKHAKEENVLKYSASREELLTSIMETGVAQIEDTLLERSSRCQNGKCQNKGNSFVARIPVTSVLFYLSWKLIGLTKATQTKLQKKYDEYSQFTHSYLQTVQYHPFSSELEVKLWVEETKDFLKLTDLVVNSLVGVLEKSV